MLQARTQTGSTDQTEPIDLVKREGKLREMARTAILYKLASDYEEKLAQLKQSYSEKKAKWFDALVQGIKDSEGGMAAVGEIARKLDLPQQRLNQFGIELNRAGIIEPAAMRGKELEPGEDGEAPRIVPQHAKNDPNSDDYEEPSRSLAALFAPDTKGTEGDDLFVGPDFTDDFENGVLSYDVTDPTSMEPDEDDGLERTSMAKPGGLSIEQSKVLDRYDELVKSIASLRGTLKSNGKRFGTEPGDIREQDDSKSVSFQQEILQRKRQELANLIRQYGSLIQKYRDLGKLKSLIKQDDEEIPTEFSNGSDEVDLDEVTKDRLKELAKIKK
jgi:hypothetical protein